MESIPSAPILQKMTLEDIIRARLESPYNLPTDFHHFPRFRSFEERYELMQKIQLQLFFKALNKKIREDANDSDSDTDQEGESGMISESDFEDRGHLFNAERLDLVRSLQFRQLGISGGLRLGVHGGYGRGSGGWARGDERLSEFLDSAFGEDTWSLEPGEILDGVEDVPMDIEGGNTVGDNLGNFRVVNLLYGPLLSPPSSPIGNPRKWRHPEQNSPGQSASSSLDRSLINETPWDSRNNNASSFGEIMDIASSSRETMGNASNSSETRDNPLLRQIGDLDSPKSSVGSRGVIANVGLLPTNSVESTLPREEGKVWPKFERPLAFNPPTTSAKKPKTKPLRWADVHLNLQAISGGEVQSRKGCSDELQNFQRVVSAELRQYIVNRSHPARIERAIRVKHAMRDTMRALEVTFVGENCSMQKFSPWRGDLIIRLRHGRPWPSYLESFKDELKREFSNGELVLRIGHFEKLPSILFPSDFEYHPYTKVELYAFNPMDTSPPKKWKFLGNQTKLENALIYHPPYESPGKFLKVGTQLRDSNTEFEPLVPRRGDVIIKREAWDPNYHHNVNFWYSMVKWHRGTKFPFVVGDMLVRRFIDNQYNEQKPLNIPRNPLLWGWAELYEYQDPHNWIFWGRTKHYYDVPLVDVGDKILMNSRITFTCDKGEDSEQDMDYEIVNPRLDAS